VDKIGLAERSFDFKLQGVSKPNELFHLLTQQLVNCASVTEDHKTKAAMLLQSAPFYIVLPLQPRLVDLAHLVEHREEAILVNALRNATNEDLPTLLPEFPVRRARRIPVSR